MGGVMATKEFNAIVIRRAAGLIATHGLILALGSLLIVGSAQAGLSLLDDWARRSLPPSGIAHFFFLRGWFTQIQSLLVAIPTALVTAWATNISISKNNDGREENAIQAISKTSGKVIAVGVTGLIFALCTTMGWILLFVPGAVLMTMWIVSVPAAAVEDLSPIKALARSAALTKGRRWDVLWLLVMLGVASGVLNFLIIKAIAGGLSFRAALETESVRLIEQPILFGIVQVVIAALVASIYVELVELSGGAAKRHGAEAVEAVAT